ncbi:MAG: hypothetical protein KDH98_23555 [Calditrichaeota bacterium]|nr:hypothetical protein [Calditrichota bacterium]
MAKYKILQNVKSFDDLDRFTADIIQNMWNALESVGNDRIASIFNSLNGLPEHALVSGQYELLILIKSFIFQQIEKRQLKLTLNPEALNSYKELNETIIQALEKAKKGK